MPDVLDAAVRRGELLLETVKGNVDFGFGQFVSLRCHAHRQSLRRLERWEETQALCKVAQWRFAPPSGKTIQDQKQKQVELIVRVPCREPSGEPSSTPARDGPPLYYRCLPSSRCCAASQDFVLKLRGRRTWHRGPRFMSRLLLRFG